jgi:hypothetical protein
MGLLRWYRMRVDRTRSQFLATAEERATWVAPATVAATLPIPESTPMHASSVEKIFLSVGR